MKRNPNPARGESVSTAKLTREDVRLIRQLVEERKRLRQEARNLTNEKIGEKFGVSANTIKGIGNYETWRWL